MRPVPAPLALAVAAMLALGACSATDDGDSETEAGALAAAQAYVDAIAARDLSAAEEMTAPDAWQYAPGPDEDVDIREALPEAADPITDPWVALISPGDETRYGGVDYVIDVSYTLDGLTGGGTIVLALDDDADPTQVDSWTVTDPLLARAETFADRGVPTARVGGVELSYGGIQNAGVVGYPGGYLLSTETPDVEPLWIAVGAADAPPWNVSLPRLETRDQDE